MKKLSVYASKLIKKRRYWPKYINRGDINAHFKDEDVGYSSRLLGMMDGIHFDVFAMKEPDYTIMLMITYG